MRRRAQVTLESPMMAFGKWEGAVAAQSGTLERGPEPPFYLNNAISPAKTPL
jgi:hypothetical protein